MDSDSRHSLPISSMGNYQDYLKKQPTPLRELESQPVRQHMFGNPFKINKNMMMADEVSGIVDEVQLLGQVPGQMGAGRGVKRPVDQGGFAPAPPKRRKGALPKDFQYQSPNSSPAHSVEYPTPPPSPQVPMTMTNGVSVAGGLGPVYPGGKMAAFKQLCDTDLDTDNEVLVINDQPAADTKHEENGEPHVGGESQPIAAVVDNNGLRHPDHEVQRKVPTPPQAAPVPQLVTNGDHEDEEEVVVVKKVVKNHVDSNHDMANDKAKVKRSASVESLSPEELRSIKLRNNNVRQLIYKEVKKPGKSHTELWEMLANLHGPPYIKRQFIQEVRQEAIRFKRLRLAEQLQRRSEAMMESEVR